MKTVIFLNVFKTNSRTQNAVYVFAKSHLKCVTKNSWKECKKKGKKMLNRMAFQM